MGNRIKSVELTIDPNLKKVDDLTKQILRVKDKYSDNRFGVKNQEQMDPEGGSTGGVSASGDGVAAPTEETVVGKVKGKAGSIIKKGKNWIKKKK